MGKPGVILIGGPTASGKSALATAIARAFGGTVINADSMQVYRELRVLTWRPSPAEEAELPYRLYGVLTGTQACSVARWRALAMAEIEAVVARGGMAILVGGTGLYFHALLHGLAPVPEIPTAARAQAQVLLDRLGAAGLHRALDVRDPVMAARLRPSDSQRLVRAYAVIEATGRSLRDWQAAAPAGSAFSWPHAAILVQPPRPALYARCDERFAAMLAAGALDEVRALLDAKLDPALPIMKALGVPELARHLAGELSLGQAKLAATQATRRYAKRQSTWFRHRFESNIILEKIDNTQDTDPNDKEIFSFIRKFLLTAEGRSS